MRINKIITKGKYFDLLSNHLSTYARFNCIATSQRTVRLNFNMKTFHEMYRGGYKLLKEMFVSAVTQQLFCMKFLTDGCYAKKPPLLILNRQLSCHGLCL